MDADVRFPDLFYVASFAVIVPLWDYRVSWPAFQRQSRADPARARSRLWAMSILWQWGLVAVGAALWVANDRSWASLGFSVPDGWRWWTSIGSFLLIAGYHAYAVATVARDSAARASVLQQVEKLSAVLPHTRTETHRFAGVALTAGFCEEFLFRGYFIWVAAAWLGWWGAAALSLLVFAVGHAYQGWNGILRTGIVGAFFVLAVALFDSLWPAIALHATIDLGQGMIAWVALREERTTAVPAVSSGPGR